MKNQNSMKQYLLFIYGEYKNTEKIIDLIALQISNFTNKDSYVKYNYGDSSAVMFFESEFSFYELRDYVHLILENICSQYFLMERPVSMYAHMPPELKLNLFNLMEDNIKDEEENMEDEEKEKDNNYNILDMFDNFLMNTAGNIFSNYSFSDEDMERMFTNVTKKLKDENEEEDVTIDDILDKIQKQGIESLSKKEKEILDEYSKT